MSNTKFWFQKGIVLASTMMVGGVLVASAGIIEANADTIPNTTSTSNGNTTIMSDASTTAETSQSIATPEQLETLDPYVSVENNQYVLQKSAQKVTSPQIFQAAQTQIQTTNRYISTNGLTINPDNLTINPDTMASVLRASRSRPSHETRSYWWGERHIFRSHAAIENFAYNLDKASKSAGLGVIFGGATANIPFTVVSGLTAAYFGNMASDLRHMESLHRHSKIYMDVNYSLIYKIKVWNGH
ncbi:hypothetical protein FC96_GL000931 [Secundilactobacillus kimchicus JCM 15530]|uniref:Uncharacterized protein n=2 Tax=Secundilactobacillus kimchicus TaxID=528209 RepID=A0A0R1HQL8_9LACO|nr:hypothetical protein [Secundilactobacillus kimchicus]KRK46787.1 hypothetical protein FC96_GL000931 [Secundilactobacillus kimchicus JCM 15530]